MSADFSKPTGDDQYTDILPQVRDNQAANAVMFNGVAASNIPVNSVQFASGQFNIWDGAAWNVQPIAIAGGGTGATNAADARTNLGLSSKTEADALYLKSASNGADIDDKSIFRTEIDVYSKTDADNRNILKADNLSTVNNPATSFNNIKQAATESSSGVVEKATPLEAISGASDKFMDSELTLSLIGRRVLTFRVNWNGSSYDVVDILGNSGFILITTSGAGTFTVDHSQSTTSYGVHVTAIDSAARTCTYSNVTSNDFEVYIRDSSGSLVSNQDAIVTLFLPI